MEFASILARQAPPPPPPPLPPGADTNSTETRTALLYGFMGLFVPVAFLALSLRLYSRWRFTGIGGDDILAVVSFVLYLGLTVATVFAAKYGLGHHIWTITQEAGVLMQKCGFSSQVLYPPTLCAIKMSVVVFFIRCLPVGHAAKPYLYGLAAFIFVEEAALTIGLFVQCRPLNFYWDKSVEGSCFNQPAFYYVDAALNLATDLVILSLPWILFRKLNVSKRQKYLVVALCSLGVFTIISSILRLPYLYNLNQSEDPTWSVVNIVIWSVAEVGSAIALSSVPAIRPLFAHVFSKNTSSGSDESIKNLKKTSKSNLPFSIGTFGSVADKSAWKNQKQMFSAKSENHGEEKSSMEIHLSREQGASSSVAK